MPFVYVLWSSPVWDLCLVSSLRSKEVSNIGAGNLTSDEPCESRPARAQSSGLCVSVAGQRWVLLARGFISTTAIRR